MKKYDYVIVGAGLSGAVCANILKNKYNKRVLLIEKEKYVGGMCYTKKMSKIDVHVYGAHIFRTSDKDIWDYMNQFAEFNNFINSPIANYHGEIYNMPFNMNTFSKIWDDVITPEDAKRHIEADKPKLDREPQNLEEHAINMVGETIYRKLVKEYTEKQWNKKCNELDKSIIRRLPLRFTYDNNYFNDRYQGIPTCGYTKMIENMLKGIDVVKDYDYQMHREHISNISINVIYTGALDEYFNYCYGELEWRSLMFDYKTYNKENYQGNAVINYTSHDVPYTRSIEHKHFNYIPGNNKTVVSYEYPCDYTPGLKKYYSVNNEKNNELANKYKELAKKENNVIFVGRLAEYKYYDMNDVIKRAFEVCNEIGGE